MGYGWWSDGKRWPNGLWGAVFGGTGRFLGGFWDGEAFFWLRANRAPEAGFAAFPKWEKLDTMCYVNAPTFQRSAACNRGFYGVVRASLVSPFVRYSRFQLRQGWSSRFPNARLPVSKGAIWG
jgi:hypothetical protein